MLRRLSGAVLAALLVFVCPVGAWAEEPAAGGPGASFADEPITLLRTDTFKFIELGLVRVHAEVNQSWPLTPDDPNVTFQTSVDEEVGVNLCIQAHRRVALLGSISMPAPSLFTGPDLQVRAVLRFAVE